MAKRKAGVTTEPALLVSGSKIERRNGADALRAAVESLMDDPERAVVVQGSVAGRTPVRAVQPGSSGIAEIKVRDAALDAYDVAPRLAAAISTLGNNTVAGLLGVSRSQPGRWARGEEGISPANEAAILDLDFVLSLLLRAMTPDLAGIWLVSPNDHLNGARPVDAFRLDGHRRVVDAITAYADGSYA